MENLMFFCVFTVTLNFKAWCVWYQFIQREPMFYVMQTNWVFFDGLCVLNFSVFFPKKTGLLNICAYIIQQKN